MLIIWYNIHNIGRCAVTPLAARTFDQIYAALGAGYDGSANLLNQKMNLLPGQADAEISGLDAKLKEANVGILDGARRRGLGFSGIPVAEQARYAATDYAPAVAKVRDNARTQAMSLQEALLGLDRDRRVQAEGIYNNELTRDLQERQFAAQMAEAAAARAAAGGGGGYSFGGGADLGGGQPQQAQRTRPGTQKDEQWAYNSVATMLSKNNDKGLMSDYLATAASAKRGNIGDLYKLQMYRAKRPDLFKAKYQWEKNYGF